MHHPTALGGFNADWWLSQHRELALRLPKLRKYAVNLVRVSPGDDEPDYDGMAELWFDREEDLFDAYKTEIGSLVAEDSMARVVSACSHLNPVKLSFQLLVEKVASSICECTQC